jgi:stage II sporulation protein D
MLHRLLTLALVVLLAGCAPAQKFRKASTGVPVARILLARDAASVALSADGPFRVSYSERGSSSDVLSRGGKVRVRWDEGNRVLVLLPGAESPVEHTLPLHIAGTEGRAAISVDGKPYRGKIDLVRGNGGMLIINAVDIESYLRGVVPAEIGYLEEKKMEAVKAQAVAARTYALKRLGTGKNKNYDLEATVADQVYKGKSAEQVLSDRAIVETAGVVAMHRGRLIDAYYSSTCGGRTAAIRDVWEKENASYLRGVRDCARGQSEKNQAYCRGSTYFEWTVTWTGDELHRTLSRSLPNVLGKSIDIGEIKDIRIRGSHRCGRVKTLEIRTTGGTYRVKGDRVRWVLRQPGNGNALWSAKFKIKVKRSRGRVSQVVATGQGFGHGVGMCQEGAIQMSREGIRYEDILKHYYPGIRLEKMVYDPVS